MVTDKIEALINAAVAVRKNAYAPYSDFNVGSAVLLDDGKTIIAGCNVENASYGLCICAERSAICQTIALGKRFTTIAVAAVPMATPCGACRQFIAEFGDSIQVVCCDADQPQNRTRYCISELLPAGFSANSLHR